MVVVRLYSYWMTTSSSHQMSAYNDTGQAHNV
nr:MAG TPA: hypothetical protein [Caudoviricetes sp.]